MPYAEKKEPVASQADKRLPRPLGESDPLPRRLVRGSLEPKEESKLPTSQA